MLKNTIFVFFFVFIMFLFSCKENKKVIIKKEQKVLILPESKDTTNIFTTNFELESIVPIETNDELLLGLITKVIQVKNKYVILCSRESIICVIDSQTGKKEMVINRRGNGPGESKYIFDIAYDEQTDNIIVFNDYLKLLFFNFQGDFIREEFVGAMWTNILCNNGKIIFYNKIDNELVYSYLFETYDIKTRDRKLFGEKSSVDFAYMMYGRYIVKSKNTWFSPWLGYDLCMLKDSGIIFSYKLQPEHPITDRLVAKLRENPKDFSHEVRSNKIIFGVTSVRETDGFLFFKSNLSSDFFLVDKTTLSIYRHGTIYDKNTGMYISNYYPHDADDNRIMFIVNPVELRGRRPVDTDKIPVHIKEMFDSLINIEDEDNPILFFYKEKKH